MQEAQLRCAHERHQGDSEAVRSRESEEDLVKLLNTIYNYPYYYRGDNTGPVLPTPGTAPSACWASGDLLASEAARPRG